MWRATGAAALGSRLRQTLASATLSLSQSMALRLISLARGSQTRLPRSGARRSCLIIWDDRRSIMGDQRPAIFQVGQIVFALLSHRLLEMDRIRPILVARHEPPMWSAR